MNIHLERLGSGTLVYGLGQVLSRGMNFLLLPLLTTYLPPENYGIISLLMMYSFLAAPIFGLGLGNSIGVVYFEDNSPARKQNTIWTSFAILCISSALFVAVSFGFSSSISLIAFQTVEYGDLIQIACIGTVFNGIINQPFIYRLQFEQKSKRFVIVTFLSTLVSLALVVWFVVVLQHGVRGFMIATLIGNIVNFFMYFFSVASWTRFSGDRHVALLLLKYGYPMIPSFLFLFIVQNSGRFMLQRYLGTSEVGIYSVGYTFGAIINVMVTAFTTAWFPYFNSFISKQDEARIVFGKTFLYYILSMGTLCLMFFIFARPLVALMTESVYYEAYSVVGPISLGNFFVGTFSILTASVYFAKRLYLVNAVQLGGAISCLLLNIMLIPSLGMIGAAVSFVVANLCMTLFQFWTNSTLKLLHINYDWKRIRHFAITAVLVIVVTSIPKNFSDLQELLMSLVLFVVLGILLFAQLNADERRVIVNLMSAVGRKRD